MKKLDKEFEDFRLFYDAIITVPKIRFSLDKWAEILKKKKFNFSLVNPYIAEKLYNPSVNLVPNSQKRVRIFESKTELDNFDVFINFVEEFLGGELPNAEGLILSYLLAKEAFNEKGIDEYYLFGVDKRENFLWGNGVTEKIVPAISRIYKKGSEENLILDLVPWDGTIPPKRYFVVFGG